MFAKAPGAVPRSAWLNTRDEPEGVGTVLEPLVERVVRVEVDVGVLEVGAELVAVDGFVVGLLLVAVDDVGADEVGVDEVALVGEELVADVERVLDELDFGEVPACVERALLVGRACGVCVAC